MSAALPPHRGPVSALATGLAVMALAAVVVWRGAGGPTVPERVVAPPPEPAATMPAARDRRDDLGREAGPQLPRRARTRARHALDGYVAGSGRTVTESERDALMIALARVRAASRWLQRHARGHPERAREHRQALLDAERVFRDTLGVGLGQFIATQSAPGTIEDLGAAPQ